MKNLPTTIDTITTLQAMPFAKDILDNLLERKQELEDIMVIIQPLLFKLSVKLYGDDSSTISLQKIVEDGIKLIDKEIL